MTVRGWVVGVLLGAFASAAGAVERDGAFIYQAYCASCHGVAGRGDGPDADLFSPPPRNLRAGVLAQYGDDELVERIRRGKALALSRDPARLHQRAADTEILVAHLERLPRIAWAPVERGEEIYVERCEVCHGPFGRAPAPLPAGVTTRPRDLSDPAYQRGTTDAVLLERLRHGHRGMPAIPGFEVRANRDALLAFVRVLSPGYERYSRSCAGCHGDDGRGPGATWATEKRPSIVFDAAYLEGKDPEALRRDVWHMVEDATPQMPHLSRVLRPRDVRAILTHLRALPAE